MLQRIKAEVQTLQAQLRAVPVAMMLSAGVALCVYHYYGTDGFFDSVIRGRLHLNGHDSDFVRCLYWCYSPFVTLVIFPYAVTGVVRLFVGGKRPPSGWGAGDWRLGGSVCAIFAVVAVVCALIASRGAEFRGMYPLCGEAHRSLFRFAIYEASFALYFVAWESFFRGFLTLGLEEQFGTWVIFAQMLPFVVIHFDKPFLEAFSSVFGGVALGYLALRTRSFLYGAFLHAAMAICLDVVIISSTGFHN